MNFLFGVEIPTFCLACKLRVYSENNIFASVQNLKRIVKEEKMARIEAEKRERISEVKKGKECTELKFRLSIHGEDMHYPGEMISGCKLMEKCIDCCTELSNIRDNGDGGLFVRTEGNILRPVHMLDAVEIVCWLIKEGNRSRLYGYEMYKTSEYNKETDRSEVFDEPILTVKGNVTFVIHK